MRSNRETSSSPIGSPWVVVLAGGDGLRLSSVTRDREGRHVPKQFCSFTNDGALLTQALGRAASLAPSDRVIVVVQEAHRHWWEAALGMLPGDNVIVESINRGTGVAVLRVLRHVMERDPDPYLVFLPSDQGVEDEHAWRRTLRRLVEAATRWPSDVVLIGMEVPFDGELGWLVPGLASPDGTRPVLRFVEKPAAEPESQHLGRSGNLCSTFVFAASAGALLALYGGLAPNLIARHAWMSSGYTSPETNRETMIDLPACDFSRDLLERRPHSIRVLPGPACGWTDLGTPTRLAQWRVRRLDLDRATRGARYPWSGTRLPAALALLDGDDL